ncbi:MAG: DUF3990 domain-containing protein [Paludibacteraceae bacterium]|nr:DUF3990 domain-containing protein [Paludibacteraceae bacterium]
MRVYHGSIERVPSPEIRESNRTLDYGSGFYTTTSPQQAEDWVHKRIDTNSVRKGFVNEYELDLDKLKSMKCLCFDRPTEEWLDFVMANRTDKDFQHDYDVVYGPVANDRVYAAFALYEGGLLSKQNLIAELQTYKLVDQYLFHTERALQALIFINAKEVLK